MKAAVQKLIFTPHPPPALSASNAPDKLVGGVTVQPWGLPATAALWTFGKHGNIARLNTVCEHCGRLLESDEEEHCVKAEVSAPTQWVLPPPTLFFNRCSVTQVCVSQHMTRTTTTMMMMRT